MRRMRDHAPTNRRFAGSDKSAFSLAEIVVVVIILGVLAAIVVPQFTKAGTAVQQDAVKNQLRTIRAAIELYRAQHQDIPPDLNEGWTPLLTRSDAVGRPAGSPLFGPYLPNPPVNPLTHASKISSLPMPGVDWWWDSSTGTVAALDESGAAFIETP
jgi:general secretion pathway protein G